MDIAFIRRSAVLGKVNHVNSVSTIGNKAKQLKLERQCLFLFPADITISVYWRKVFPLCVVCDFRKSDLNLSVSTTAFLPPSADYRGDDFNRFFRCADAPTPVGLPHILHDSVNVLMYSAAEIVADVFEIVRFITAQRRLGDRLLRQAVPASSHALHAGLSSVPVLLRPCCPPLSIVHHRETNSSVFISESIRAFRPRSLFFHRSPLKNFVSRNSIGTNKCPP